MGILDTGATSWMLISAALVFLMTPALAFFYGGMCRQKTTLNMMMMSVVAMGIVGVIYPLYGYVMSYGSGDVLGVFAWSFKELNLENIVFDSSGNFLLDDNGVPVIVGVAFQSTFAILTVALISGSLAARTKFSAWLFFIPFWVTLVYFPLAHMVWGGGLLSESDFSISALLFGSDGSQASVAPIDFAGGTVVHMNAGIAGLVLVFFVGKRHGFGKREYVPHSLPFVFLGAAGLWFGWFGFNAGSSLTADGLAGWAWVNTSTAASAGILGWILTDKMRGKSMSVLGSASGMVSGLVAITPGCGAVNVVGAIVIGGVAGSLCSLAISMKNYFGYDDSLDVVGVHLTGGFIGTVLIGFFATDGGLFYGGNYQLLVVQIVVTVCAMLYSGLGTFIVAMIIKVLIGWRVSDEEEHTGIDVIAHGENAYVHI